jgi:hypothetical protein
MEEAACPWEAACALGLMDGTPSRVGVVRRGAPLDRMRIEDGVEKSVLETVPP